MINVYICFSLVYHARGNHGKSIQGFGFCHALGIMAETVIPLQTSMERMTFGRIQVSSTVHPYDRQPGYGDKDNTSGRQIQIHRNQRAKRTTRARIGS